MRALAAPFAIALACVLAPALPQRPGPGQGQPEASPPEPPPITLEQRLGPPPRALRRTLHPPVPLRDAQGRLVIESGLPLSLTETCGTCHDTRYITEHSYHAGIAGPAQSETSAPSGLDCLLCHIAAPNHGERGAELRAGRTEFAATATLLGTGLVERGADGSLQWQPQMLDERGAVAAERLGLGRPRNENCRACHMAEGRYEDEVLFTFSARNHSAATTGTVFAAGRMFDSAMNLAHKADLSTPWDVHAERLVGCADCHHSPNSPVHAAKGEGTRPGHLRFDARRSTTGDWLQRPDHDLVTGYAAQSRRARAFAGTMRGCADCHDAAMAHPSLPHAEEHFAKLTCTACHVPHVHGAPRRSTDWTLLGPDREPIVAHRGAAGDPADPATLIEGYRPVLLWQERGAAGMRLAPHNLEATWYWTQVTAAAEANGHGAPPAPAREPVARRVLERACFVQPGGGYHPALIAALDSNRDGRLAESELRLDAPAKIEAMRERLRAEGARDPEIAAELLPYTIAHGVQASGFALRQCTECHGHGSRIGGGMRLADHVPGGVLPALPQDRGLLGPGRFERTADGGLVYHPESPRALAYVHGTAPLGPLDRLGIAVLLLCLAGAAAHGSLRLVAARRRRRSAP